MTSMRQRTTNLAVHRARGSAAAAALACLPFLLFARPASAQVSYGYTGQPFNLFSCYLDTETPPATVLCSNPPAGGTSYTTSNFVTATLTLNSALPPNLNYVDVSGYPGFKLTMSDGQQTLTSGTPASCCVKAFASTDAGGQIIGPWLFIVYGLFPPNNGIYTENVPSFPANDNGDLTCLSGELCNIGFVFGAGTWGAGGITPTSSFGTFTRLTQKSTCCDGVVVDNVDAIEGGSGVPRTVRIGGSNFGLQAAQGVFAPLTLNGTTLTNNGPTAGAWSYADLGVGAGRGIAFATFTNNSTITSFKLNAVFNGEFQPDSYGLPEGTLAGGAAIHVYDTDKFNAAINAGIGTGTLGQFLLGGYSPTDALNPNVVFDNLSTILASAEIGKAVVTYGNGPFNPPPFTPPDPPIQANLTTQFTIPIGKSFTVLFDVTASSQTQIFGAGWDYTQGTGTVDLIDTLKPAPNFLTDTNGNPVTGITAVGAPATLPPATAAVSLAPATGADAAGSTHTVTAMVTDTSGGAVPSAMVKFTVTGGPNAGVTGTGVTNVAGQASFTYTDKGGAGTDLIQASTGAHLSNFVQETWRPAKCPNGQGYWKTHSNAWPVSSLTLGSQTYNKSQLQQILSSPGGGDASMILAVQFVAAKLNIANGSDPTPISNAIGLADGLLAGFPGILPYNVNPGSANGQSMTQGGAKFDSYNSGQLTSSCVQ